MKSLLLFLVICHFLLTSASAEPSAMSGGGWKAIRNLKDPKVVGIAEFAVTEYNKRVNSMLGLVSVVRGEIQMVSSINYRLVILAKDKLTAAVSNYILVVWDKPSKKERSLISFQKVAY